MQKGDKLFFGGGFSFRGLWEVEALVSIDTKHVKGIMVTLRKIGQKGVPLANSYNNVKTVPLDSIMKGMRLSKVERVA